MVDRAITAHPLGIAWLALAKRIAVAAGALAALVSLIYDTPLWVASLRGALTWLALVVLARVSRTLLVMSLRSAPTKPAAGEHK